MGSIASMNGRDPDEYKFRNRDTYPTFYGIIEELTVLDDIGCGGTQISLLSVVSMSGWIRGSYI